MNFALLLLAPDSRKDKRLSAGCTDFFDGVGIVEDLDKFFNAKTKEEGRRFETILVIVIHTY